MNQVRAASRKEVLATPRHLLIQRTHLLIRRTHLLFRRTHLLFRQTHIHLSKLFQQQPRALSRRLTQREYMGHN